MKSLTKKVLIILACVMLIGIVAALPGFAETQDELKEIFVTRDEIDFWLNKEILGTYMSSSYTSNASSTAYVDIPVSIEGMSKQLDNLEVRMQQSIQGKVKIEMSRRNIKESTTTAGS